MRRNNNLKKNSNLDVHKEEGFHTSSKFLDSKILGGGDYQTSHENLNPSITEERFQASLINSTPVDCEEGSNQTSLCDTTSSYSKESKAKNSLILLENIKFPRVGIPKKDNYNQNHIIKDLIKKMQLYRLNIKTFYKRKNKPSSKILASTQVQSQEIIEKFMRKRKSKRKEKESNICERYFT